MKKSIQMMLKLIATCWGQASPRIISRGSACIRTVRSKALALARNAKPKEEVGGVFILAAPKRQGEERQCSVLLTEVEDAANTQDATKVPLGPLANASRMEADAAARRKAA